MPWYNCNGWLGVQHQVTYLLTALMRKVLQCASGLAEIQQVWKYAGTCAEGSLEVQWNLCGRKFGSTMEPVRKAVWKYSGTCAEGNLEVRWNLCWRMFGSTVEPVLKEQSWREKPWAETFRPSFKATLVKHFPMFELRSCVKVKVAVLGSPIFHKATLNTKRYKRTLIYYAYLLLHIVCPCHSKEAFFWTFLCLDLVLEC